MPSERIDWTIIEKWKRQPRENFPHPFCAVLRCHHPLHFLNFRLTPLGTSFAKGVACPRKVCKLHFRILSRQNDSRRTGLKSGQDGRLDVRGLRPLFVQSGRDSMSIPG